MRLSEGTGPPARALTPLTGMQGLMAGRILNRRELPKQTDPGELPAPIPLA